MKMILKAALLAFIAVTGTAHALPVSGQGTWETTLQGRDINGDGGADAFYDTALKITWLADADLHRGYGSSSQMTFAAEFSFGGAEDWRLPNWVDAGAPGCQYGYFGGTDCGFNTLTLSEGIVYSEMSHLWYVSLGNTARCYEAYGNPRCDGYFENTGNFQGLQLADYWAGSGPLGRKNVVFSMYNGGQESGEYVLGGSAMLVHDGDIFAPPAPIPEPETYALMLAGLAVVSVAARRSQPVKAAPKRVAP